MQTEEKEESVAPATNPSWASARSEQQNQVPQDQGDDAAHGYYAASQHAEAQNWPQEAMQTEDKEESVVSATNPNEAPVKTTPPWRQESQEEGPSKRQRVSRYAGVVYQWLPQYNYGFAYFEGCSSERVFIHVNDLQDLSLIHI